MGSIAAVVLAAGKGTRMKSSRPKALHPLAGKAMLQHVVDILSTLNIDPIHIVIGHGAQEVRDKISGNVNWILQEDQLGTGHALAQTSEALSNFAGEIIVTCVDTPLFGPESFRACLEQHWQQNNAATIISAQVASPFGYGRIVRSQGKVSAIIEEKDASPEQKKINEVNSGTYCFSWPLISRALSNLRPDNAQGEYYLTDIISQLFQSGQRVDAWVLPDPGEMMGINDRVQLAAAEKYYKLRLCRQLMLSGVTIADPDSTWVEAGVRVGPDTVILPNTHLAGATIIGQNCLIGPDVTIRDCRIQENVTIRNSVLDQSEIGSSVVIGPYAYLRPGCKIGDDVKVGDFVELKNAHLGHGSKVPHLAYVGDARIGEACNIGCGVITANYDGKNKNITQIGDRVFVGSNATLIAPVCLDNDSFIAAGSTIIQDVPAKALAIARCRQTVKQNWRSDD